MLGSGLVEEPNSPVRHSSSGGVKNTQDALHGKVGCLNVHGLAVRIPPQAENANNNIYHIRMSM